MDMVMEQGSAMDAAMDRVEHALLSAGVGRQVRVPLLEKLQAEIVEGARTSAGAEPTEREVSRRLDAMGLTGRGPVAVPGAVSSREWRRLLKSVTPRRSRCATWGVFCVAMSLLPVVGILLFLAFFSPAGIHIEANFPRQHFQTSVDSSLAEATTMINATGQDGTLMATINSAKPFSRFLWLFAPLSPLALAATLLGLFAIVDIRRSGGRVTGFGAALFALMFYPIFLTLMAIWL